MRFGREMTQTQIATELGFSQMHISRLLTRTLTVGRCCWLGPQSGLLRQLQCLWGSPARGRRHRRRIEH